MSKNVFTVKFVAVPKNAPALTDTQTAAVKTRADRVIEDAARLGDVFRGVYGYTHRKVITGRRELVKINGRRTPRAGVMVRFEFEGSRDLTGIERARVKTNLDQIFGQALTEGSLAVAGLNFGGYYTNSVKPKAPKAKPAPVVAPVIATVGRRAPRYG